MSHEPSEANSELDLEASKYRKKQRNDETKGEAKIRTKEYKEWW
jgi:hypothetical protein